MSDHDEVMERLDWCVTALKALLGNQVVAPSPEAPVVDDPELADDPEVAAMLATVQDTPPPRCTHQHQRKEGRNIVCAKCGDLLIAGSGIVDTSAGQRAPWLADPERRG